MKRWATRSTILLIAIVPIINLKIKLKNMEIILAIGVFVTILIVASIKDDTIKIRDRR